MSIDWKDGRVITWYHEDQWQEIRVLHEVLDMICEELIDDANADTIKGDMEELFELLTRQDDMQYTLELIDEIGSLVFPGYRLGKDEAGDWRFMEVVDENL